jgi:ATP-dependent protease Clp ATPase subunit
MASCTFCGSSRQAAPALVAGGGPGVYICADCVSYARTVLGAADEIVPRTGSAPANPPLDLRCSFCDRPAAQVRRLIAGPDVRICDQCVGVAEVALAERA